MPKRAKAKRVVTRVTRGETRSGKDFGLRKKVYYSSMSALKSAHQDLFAAEPSCFISGNVFWSSFWHFSELVSHPSLWLSAEQRLATTGGHGVIVAPVRVPANCPPARVKRALAEAFAVLFRLFGTGEEYLVRSEVYVHG